MNAPDKIYLSVVTSMLTKQQDLHQEWQYSPLKFANDNIEYIRKDLLLEWAKEEKVKCSSETNPYAMFMNVVIDKLNSL